MTSNAKTPAEYLEELPEDRKAVVKKLYGMLCAKMPKGFEPVMQYGMITFVVPHSLYPKGYHATPELPLPYLSLASQKNFVALYHMGLYSNSKQLAAFQKAYNDTGFKLDMGKSCIRLKNLDKIPYDVLANSITIYTPASFIERYEKALADRPKR